MKFALIGDGYVAQYHKQAIDRLGGTIERIFDPKHGRGHEAIYPTFFEDIDYVVICSPSHLHGEHTKLALAHDKKVIVEKPMVLPWEPIIDDDRINVVLQYRWAFLPSSAELVRVKFVRDSEYLKSAKGNPMLTGGAFFNLYIHYVDLAIRLGADFDGNIFMVGEQERYVDDFNLATLDTNSLYQRMYADIVLNGGGVKPKELRFLHWLLNNKDDGPPWEHGLSISRKRYSSL